MVSQNISEHGCVVLYTRTTVGLRYRLTLSPCPKETTTQSVFVKKKAFGKCLTKRMSADQKAMGEPTLLVFLLGCDFHFSLVTTFDNWVTRMRAAVVSLHDASKVNNLFWPNSIPFELCKYALLSWAQLVLKCAFVIAKLVNYYCDIYRWVFKSQLHFLFVHWIWTNNNSTKVIT